MCNYSSTDGVDLLVVRATFPVVPCNITFLFVLHKYHQPSLNWRIGDPGKEKRI